MKNLIIIGAGGFFLEVFEYIYSDIESQRLNHLNIKGGLADLAPNSKLPIDYLGSIDSYKPEKNDIFIIAIGSATARQVIYSKLKSKSATFLTYVHPSAMVSPSAIIGEGSIICPMAIVNAFAVIGDNVSLNVHASVGHEAQVGAHSVLSPYSALNGGASVGKKVFLGTRATIFPKVHIGDDCIVDSHSAVRKNANFGFMLSERSQSICVKNRLLR